MGKKSSKHPYARARGRNIQINFRYRGTLHQPFVNLEPTPKNLQYASKLAHEIREKIKHGLFRWPDYFPEHAEANPVPTFETIARQYLASRDDLTERTLNDYKKILNAHWMPYLAGLPIDQIKYGQLSEILISREFKTPKTRNNAIIPLRGVFDLALADQWIDTNPALNLKYKKIQKAEPDPLTLDECFLYLDTVKNNQWRNYFRFALFSGCRPQEIIALQWSDIDFNSGRIQIDKVKSMGQIRQHTKTYTARQVPINSQMAMALKNQKQHTFMAGDFVFINPCTGKPINDDKPPRLVWTDNLKKAGLRHRKAYQTRSTSICLQITAGENLYKIAKDHGHNIETMLKSYAKWIDQVEVKESKLDKFLKEQNK